ncbi:MAG TPA: ATP-binding cassette domain-containing protein [Actinomycetota bacterium]|nr:ATP-binding cassette domain-containing protein [Actinomycetota bacterium]
MDPTDDAPTVEMSAATVRIGGRTILGPLDLVVRQGERWALLGPNGSGKTTLLGLAGARRQPSSGRVRVLGATLGRSDVRSLHGRIAHSSHALADLIAPGLDARAVVLTGKRSTLSPWFERYDEADGRRATALLDELGCAHLADRPFSTGSQGERQRVLLARALFTEPELVLLDEPASGLDLAAREGLLAGLERTARNGGPTTIVATHHLEEIAPSTTHAALLRHGRVLAIGPIEDVLTTEHLERAFEVAVEIGRRAGRWWAAASASDQE